MTTLQIINGCKRKKGDKNKKIKACLVYLNYIYTEYIPIKFSHIKTNQFDRAFSGFFSDNYNVVKSKDGCCKTPKTKNAWTAKFNFEVT